MIGSDCVVMSFVNSEWWCRYRSGLGWGFALLQR